MKILLASALLLLSVNAFAFVQNECEKQIYTSASALFYSSYLNDSVYATVVGKLKVMGPRDFKIDYIIKRNNGTKEIKTYAISLVEDCVIHSVIAL